MTLQIVFRGALQLRWALVVSSCLAVGGCDLVDRAKEKLGLEKPADFRTEIHAMGKAIQEFKQATSDALDTAMEKKK